MCRTDHSFNWYPSSAATGKQLLKNSSGKDISGVVYGGAAAFFLAAHFLTIHEIANAPLSYNREWEEM